MPDGEKSYRGRSKCFYGRGQYENVKRGCRYQSTLCMNLVTCSAMLGRVQTRRPSCSSSVLPPSSLILRRSSPARPHPPSSPSSVARPALVARPRSLVLLPSPSHTHHTGAITSHTDMPRPCVRHAPTVASLTEPRFSTFNAHVLYLPALATPTTPATRCLTRQLTSACLRSSASTLHIHPLVSPTVSPSCHLHHHSCSLTTTPIMRDALLPRCICCHACTHACTYAPPVHRHHSMTPSSIPTKRTAPCMPPPCTPPAAFDAQGHPYVHRVLCAHPNPQPSFSRPPQPRPGTTSPTTAPHLMPPSCTPPPCRRRIRRTHSHISTSTSRTSTSTSTSGPSPLKSKPPLSRATPPAPA